MQTNYDTVRGRRIKSTTVGDEVTISADDWEYILLNLKLPDRDLQASSKFYSQTDVMLAEGTPFENIRVKDYVDIKPNTVRSQLRVLRAIKARRECSVSVASVFRKAKKFNAINVLVMLAS